MIIRTATLADLPQIFEIGAKCYPAEEALTQEEYRGRLLVYPHHFWLLEKDQEILAFINGPVTPIDHITDETYQNPALHREDGTWQAILGVNTSPKHQGKGYASQIMKQVIRDAQAQGRKGCVLTCKPELIAYYEKFGFRNRGKSLSALASQTWYDMALLF